MNNISVVFSILDLSRQWLESIEIKHSWSARLVCRVIPASCPFEREIKFFNHTIVSIPPLCKFNPFYEQLIALRFKSLIYLADKRGEDITLYC